MPIREDTSFFEPTEVCLLKAWVFFFYVLDMVQRSGTEAESHVHHQIERALRRNKKHRHVKRA